MPSLSSQPQHIFSGRDRLSPNHRDIQQCQGDIQVTHRSRGPPQLRKRKKECTKPNQFSATGTSCGDRAMKGIESWPSSTFNQVWYRN